MITWIQEHLKRDAKSHRRHFIIDAGIVTLGILLTLVLVGFWFRLAELRATQTRLSERNTELLIQVIDFEGEIGYGGFIHNFKNAVLRPAEIVYLVSAEANIVQALRILDRIERLSASAGTPIDVAPIRDTLEEYSTATQILREHVGQPMTPTELDIMVRVRDDDALEHLARLVESARRDLRERIGDLSGSIARLTDWFSLVGALLTTLAVFMLRKRQMDTLEIRGVAGRQTAYLLDHVAEGVIGLSPRREVIFLNSAARRMLGHILQAPPFPWPEAIEIRPEDTNLADPENEDLLARAISGEHLSEILARMTRPNGTGTRLVRFSCHKVTDEYANPVVSIIVLMREASGLADLAGFDPRGNRPLAPA